MAEQQLENIFESISDMVYIVDKDYEIKKINRAVSVRRACRHQKSLEKNAIRYFTVRTSLPEYCPHQQNSKIEKGI